MNILVLGATGLIGSNVAVALLQSGYKVIAASRNKPTAMPVNQKSAKLATSYQWREIDFASMTTEQAWLPHLKNIDVVINCVGIIREVKAGDFDVLHRAAPVALFAACERLGIAQVIQVSALGSNADATTGYWRSKGAAEDDLRQRHLNASILRPSLVYGDKGASSQLFLMLATLPLLAMPLAHRALLQPIHIDDLTAAIVQLVVLGKNAPKEMATVGPRAMSMAEYLTAIRSGIRAAPAIVVDLPLPVAKVVARIAALHPTSALTPESLVMLAESANGSNTADNVDIKQLLGYIPRDPALFTRPEQKLNAVASWGLPMLRFVMAGLWLLTAYVSWFAWPHQESLQWLAACGVATAWQEPTLLAASLTDAALGLALLLRYRRWLWLLQLGLVGSYTAIMSIFLPHFWAHPFGPLSKNLPLLAIIFVMWRMAGEDMDKDTYPVNATSTQNTKTRK